MAIAKSFFLEFATFNESPDNVFSDVTFKIELDNFNPLILSLNSWGLISSDVSVAYLTASAISVKKSVKLFVLLIYVNVLIIDLFIKFFS